MSAAITAKDAFGRPNMFSIRHATEKDKLHWLFNGGNQKTNPFYGTVFRQQNTDVTPFL